MLTYFQGKHDESERHEGTEYNIEFVVTCSDAAEILEVMEQPLNFIASFVQLFVVRPWLLGVALWRHNRDALLSSDGTARDGVGISFVHHYPGAPLQFCSPEDLSSFRRIPGIAGAQDEGKTCVRSRSHQMDLGRQSSSRAPERLCALFLRAPAAL